MNGVRQGIAFVVLASIIVCLPFRSASALPQGADDVLAEHAAPAMPNPQADFVSLALKIVRSGKLENTLRQKLRQRVDHISQASGLNKVQSEKLETAGFIDIRRFCERVEQTALEGEFSKLQKLDKLCNETDEFPIDRDAGVFGNGSLFAKILKRVFTAEQSVQYEMALEERKALLLQSTVESAIAELEGQVMLRDGQRSRLERLMLERIRPPFLRFHRSDFVLVELSKIPEADLKPIFDEDQWLTMKRTLTDRRTAAEPILKAIGYLSD
jgi:hypothetical protein